jgi:hypothetical protein
MASYAMPMLARLAAEMRMPQCTLSGRSGHITRDAAEPVERLA